MDGNSSLYNSFGSALTGNATGEDTATNDIQNGCSHYTDYSDYEYELFLYEAFDFERPIYLFIWEILVIFTTLFNLLVIHVLMGKKMRSVTHTVLVAIAVSDSMTGLVTLPTYIYTYSSYPEKDAGVTVCLYPQYDDGSMITNCSQYDEGKMITNYSQYDEGKMITNYSQYDEGKMITNYSQYDEGKMITNYSQYDEGKMITDYSQYDEGKMITNYSQYDEGKMITNCSQYEEGKMITSYSQYEEETMPQDEEGEMTFPDFYELNKHWCNAFMVSKFFLSRSFHNISIWLTVFLGVQRFVSVSFPFKSQSLFTIRNTIIIIGIVSILSPFLHIYHLIYQKADVKSGFCHWTLENDGALVHLWFTLLFMHLIPCVLLVVLTCLMICHLRSSMSQVMREGSSRSMVDRRRAWNKRMSVIVSAIVIVLLIPEIPYGGFLLFTVMQEHSKNNMMPLYVNRAVHAAYEILLVLSFHANFWIYTILNKRFRSELKNSCKEVFNLVCRCVRKPSRKSSITSTSFNSPRTTDSSLTGKSGKKGKKLGGSSTSDSKSERGPLNGPSSETAEKEERL